MPVADKGGTPVAFQQIDPLPSGERYPGHTPAFPFERETKMNCQMQAAVVAVVFSCAGLANAAPSSGMLLGVYAFENWQGLRLTGTIPGYSAHGKLFRNDVLLRVTPNGNDIYSVKSHGQIEYAKDQIGPNRLASLEVFRPGEGLIYFWVEFRPVGGAAQYRAAREVEVRVMTENEKPGARALFRGTGGGSPSVNNGSNLTLKPAPTPISVQGDGNAAALFRK